MSLNELAHRAMFMNGALIPEQNDRPAQLLKQIVQKPPHIRPFEGPSPNL